MFSMTQEGRATPARMLHVPKGRSVRNPWNRNLLRMRCNTIAPTPELFEARSPDSPIHILLQGSLASMGRCFVCTFAATCLMPLGNTGYMTQHLPQPPEPMTAQQPVDVQATPCLPDNCPFDPHTRERSAYRNPVPAYHCSEQTPARSSSSAFDGSAAQPIVGTPLGMNYELQWDQVPRETQNIADPMNLVESGLVVEDRKEAGEYWCACHQVGFASSNVPTSRFDLRFRIGYGHCALC